MNNLADDPAYSRLKKKLGKKLHLWMEQQGDRGIDTELKAIERQGRTEEQWRSHEENINRRLLEGNQ